MTSRAAARRGLSKRSYRLEHPVADIRAGLVNAVVSVPDGLAAAALAGVNPVSGLYTSATATIAGGMSSSSHLMQIATTSASALAAGQAVAAFEPGDRAPAMYLLVVLAGVFLGIFGLLRAGRLVRYVSHAVMTGPCSGCRPSWCSISSRPWSGTRPREAVSWPRWPT